MAIRNRDTGEIRYEGRVYSSRGSFKCDMHTDIVEVIEITGRVTVIELNDLSREYAEVDATDENIAIMNSYAETRGRVYKIQKLRRCVAEASKTMLTPRQYIHLCIGLKNNPNWKLNQKYRGLGAEVFFANEPSVSFDNESNVTRLLQKYSGDTNLGNLSKFEKSLVQQCIEWAETAPQNRKFDKPLSDKQVAYLDKDWGWTA